MDILTKNEISDIVGSSTLVKYYNQEVDKESAYEILKEKLEKAEEEENKRLKKEEQERAIKEVEEGRKGRRKKKEEPGFIEQMSKNTMVRQLGRTVVREVTRGLLGILGVKKRR